LAIQEFGDRCLLVKHDFKSAFRHIPVSPLDTPLLGFYWDGLYYEEQFLPFGLRTATYIFNLFAEIFHWILEYKLQQHGLRAKILHYLDDFLIVLPPTADTNIYSTIFDKTCTQVRLTIKESKNKHGTATSFGGIEIDTERKVIGLPQKKLLKA